MLLTTTRSIRLTMSALIMSASFLPDAKATPDSTTNASRSYAPQATLTLVAVLALFVAAVPLASTPAVAQDADPEVSEPASDLVTGNSEYVSPLHETAYAEVHRVDLPPGARLTPHEGGERAVYSLNAYTLRFEAEGDTVAERSFESGEVHYHPSGVHAADTPENVSDETASFVIFERVEGSLPTTPSADGETLDAVTIPEGATRDVRLENDDFTVHHITLESGASLPPHFGPARVVYSLTDYTLTFVDSDSDTRSERSFAEGDLHDHEAGRHAVENTGDQPAEYLVVAFKQ